MNNSITLKDSRHGKMLFLSRDVYIGRSLEFYGEYSALETDLFAQLIRPGMTVVEVGANIGAHTVALGKMVGTGGRVIAFEPQRTIFQLLCANLALNGLFNVQTLLAGAGREEGTLIVPSLDYTAENNFGGVPLNLAGEGEQVPIAPLDAIGVSAVHFLKIDVEGMERDVLLGAREIIARDYPILYVENDRKEKSPELLTLLDELGYNCWWHLPPLFNPDNFAKESENIFPGIVSINLICLPKDANISMHGFRKITDPHDWFTE
jgi:FkbM family methyltransferase